MECRGTRWTFGIAAVFAWAVAVVIAVTTHASPATMRWMLLTVAPASVLTILAGVGWILTQGAEGAYKLGYRVGWDDGRSCERIMQAVVDDDESNVTAFPVGGKR